MNWISIEFTIFKHKLTKSERNMVFQLSNGHQPEMNLLYKLDETILFCLKRNNFITRYADHHAYIKPKTFDSTVNYEQRRGITYLNHRILD